MQQLRDGRVVQRRRLVLAELPQHIDDLIEADGVPGVGV